jgi:hypothetical protein
MYCVRRAAAPIDSIAYASLARGDSGNSFAADVEECTATLSDPNRCLDLSTPLSATIMGYSAESYRTFLRFYEVKPAYVFLLRRLHRTLHMDIFNALRAVSVASFMTMGLVFWFWFREHFSVPVASLLAVALMNTQYVLNLGKLLLPDGFSTALLLLAVYLLLYHRNKWPGAVVLFLLPLVRPDNLIFVCLFAGAFLWRSKYSVRTRISFVPVLLAVCAMMQFIMQRLTHPLPFSSLLYHSTLGWTDPSTFSSLHVSVHDYLRVLASFGGRALMLHFPLMLFFAVLALAGRNICPQLRDLVWVSLATECVRLPLFPSMEERFYTWLLLVCAIAAACTFGQLLRQAQPLSEGTQL